MQELRGKVAVVTGAASGIGLALARRLGAEGMKLVVADVAGARTELFERGVDVSEVQDFAWGSFVFFSDPDGNRWAVQQLPPRGEGAS